MAMKRNGSMSFIKDNTASKSNSTMSRDFENRLKILRSQSSKLNKSVAKNQKKIGSK